MFSVLRLDEFLIFNMDQCPELWIRPQYDMSASSAVSSVRSSLRYILGAMQMHRSRAPMSRSTIYLDVINKIALCHNSLQVLLFQVAKIAKVWRFLFVKKRRVGIIKCRIRTRPRSVFGGADCQLVIKCSVETWPKKGCVSTLLFKSYLIINELQNSPWLRPAGQFFLSILQ